MLFAQQGCWQIYLPKEMAFKYKMSIIDSYLPIKYNLGGRDGLVYRLPILHLFDDDDETSGSSSNYTRDNILTGHNPTLILMLL